MRSDTPATTPDTGREGSRAERSLSIRAAIIAAALGVAACFGAAASFAGDPAVAAEAGSGYDS